MEDLKCTKFYEQMRHILNGKNSTDNLLGKLLMIVRQYKYRCRMPFGLYVTAFWTAVLGYLVYSMTVNLDVMHIRSRWRSSSSHLLPVQRLLSHGNFQGDMEQLVYFE
ncbi:variant erythrocyte surface antigen-1 family protein protein, putative [Babesia ovis]|uniref:Variant erythrocyte surface antigen-1 family protein protein, putative n=1 Tax=Babesia ovis TaxID=5869 RepID=A0A9W5WWD7_BABOV|nr:variant erythrocyte surface antigen-1 family protein protein, putative [Babesia ovis]